MTRMERAARTGRTPTQGFDICIIFELKGAVREEEGNAFEMQGSVT